LLKASTRVIILLII